MLKTVLNDLAVFGGSPAFEQQLHVGRPNIPGRDRLMKRIEGILDRHWLTNDGPTVRELEQKISDYLGVKHCIAMCNGTIALEIAIRALGLKGEVIIPSFTFVATAHALQWQEITPVFCDIGATTHHIDPACIDALITPRTSAVLAVHVWGQPCDTEALEEVAHRNKLHVIYDAAHAFACSHRGRFIGGFGDAEIFSFHATKFFNTFEGGAVATNDDELARKIRFMRNFGFAGYDDVQYIGTNGKMSEVSAAMGLTMLESLNEVIEINRQHFVQYRHLLGDIPGLKLFSYDESEKRNFQYIIIEVDENETGINRDDLVKVLHAENVLARRYFYPGCHEMEPYRSYFPHAGMLLPNTNALTRRVMSLPNGLSVTDQDIDQVCGLIRFAASEGLAITTKLNGRGP